jgi:hypothetical protein
MPEASVLPSRNPARECGNPGGPRRGTPLHRVLVGLGDQAVIEQIRRRVRAPEIVVRTIRVAGVSRDPDLMWNEPFPAEQGRLELMTTARRKPSSNQGRGKLSR